MKRREKFLKDFPLILSFPVPIRELSGSGKSFRLQALKKIYTLSGQHPT